MKVYSYCQSFKLANYLKACEREGMGIDDLRIPCLAKPSVFRYLDLLSFFYKYIKKEVVFFHEKRNPAN